MSTLVFAEKITPRESEHTTSIGRVFKFRELSALEQMRADSASDTIQGSLYCRMAASLLSVDGKRFPPGAKPPEILARLDRIHGTEADELLIAYVEAFGPPRGDELKKESAPQPED